MSNNDQDFSDQDAANPPDNRYSAWSLSLLRCPITGEPLQWATTELLQLVNSRIAAGQLVSHSGEVAKEQLQVAVLNASQSWLYRYRATVFDLLPQDALAVDGIFAKT